LNKFNKKKSNPLIFLTYTLFGIVSTITPLIDAYHLRKRAIIETIFDQLKNIFQVEHSRHRSPVNYFTNIFSALIAYNFTEKKPSLKNDLVDTKQLILF